MRLSYWSPNYVRPQRGGKIEAGGLPEFIKAKENIHELDDFFDGWLRRCGAAGIVGYSHHAGQLADRSVSDMRPPQRTPCRGLRSRCMILFGGRVTQCDQDYSGLRSVGNVRESSLADIWGSIAFNPVRQEHLASQFDGNPLCAAFTEWHRP